MSVKTATRKYGSRPRQAAANETQAKILAAARSLLVSGKGSPAFSLDLVGREAGVTRLTVYNQFESRRGLLEAVFDDIAEEGGLFTQLPAALAEPDPAQALRKMVTVFCGFWAAHRTAIPTLLALTGLDPEVSVSLRRRMERRRVALRSLVERSDIGKPAARSDLVDTLFALTSFEMYEALTVDHRSREAIDALLQQLVEDTVRRYASGTRTSARGKSRKTVNPPASGSARQRNKR